MSQQTKTLGDIKEYARRINNDLESAKGNAQILAAIQDALKNLSQASDWTHLETRTRVVTRQEYTAGTVDVSLNQTVVSANSNASAVKAAFPASIEASNATFTMKFNGERIDYDISGRSSSNTLTIASPFIGTTHLTAVNYKIFRRSYDLPVNCREVLAVIDVRDPEQPLTRKSYKEMLELSLRRTDGSEPWCYSVEVKTGDARNQLWLYPYPDGSTRFQYDLIYQRWPNVPTADTDVLDWPDDLFPLLKAAVAVEIALENEDGERYELYKTEYSDKLREAIKGNVNESAQFYVGMHSSLGPASKGRRLHWTVTDSSS